MKKLEKCAHLFQSNIFETRLKKYSLTCILYNFSPITGKPQGPGGNLEKECSHSAFPERKRQIRKQTNTIWPNVDSSSITVEKAMLLKWKRGKEMFVARADTVPCRVQGSTELQRENDLSLNMRSNCSHLVEHLSVYRLWARYSFCVNKTTVIYWFTF